jgi:SAM-dependent methyltransferase
MAQSNAHASAMKNLDNYKFNTVERGDRINPHRSNRAYWHLRLVLDKMRRVAESDLLPAGEKILDYGCGNKPYHSLFSPKFNQYIGADLPGNEEADLIIGPQGQIPSEDNSFDCVLSSEVMEHTEDPRFYLKEAHRVLKPGGSLVLSVPAIWVYHPDPIDYWRWTIAGLQHEIRQAGFEIVLMQGVFGPESSALQLWQDATLERLPKRLRSAYTWFIQRMIGLIERRQPDKLSEDASIYVVLARKRDDGIKSENNGAPSQKQRAES